MIDGVPRLAKAARNGHAPSQRVENAFDNIRRSFSKEWSIFEYGRDNTWGWTLNERVTTFLSDVGFTRDQLKAKTILDAGCGNGTLTAMLGTLGEQVIGIDLNDSLDVANRHKTFIAGEAAERVEFVQGNLFDAPFRNQSFDLIYCSGVIHHTPDSRATFTRLVPLVRPGGRLYVWVYGKRHPFVRAFLESGRQLKRAVSLEVLMRICSLLAPFYLLGTRLLNAARVAPFRKRSAREITLDLFDAWAPQYNHWHTPSEVMAWYKEAGFTNITVAGVQKHGFGVFGDKL